MTGDEQRQRVVWRLLSGPAVKEESDFFFDDEGVPVEAPSVAVAPKSRDKLRRQRLLSSVPMCAMGRTGVLKVKTERVFGEEMEEVDEEYEDDASGGGLGAEASDKRDDEDDEEEGALGGEDGAEEGEGQEVMKMGSIGTRMRTF